MGDINDDDLDGILDSALDELAANPAPQPQPQAQPQPPQQTRPQEPSLLTDFNDPEFRKGFEELMKQIDPSATEDLDSLLANDQFLKELNSVQSLLSSFSVNPAGAPSTSAPAPAPAASSSQPKPAPASNLQDRITETMNILKDSNQEIESQVGEQDPVSNLLSMLNSGNDESMEKLLEGMMGQLMSKEVLYEPMKELATLYPDWLQESKSTLSEAEYKRCNSQYLITKKIVEVYEKEDGSKSFTQVLELMQQMQEFGQPPADLLKRMAPGLEIGADGLPKIPGLGDQCPTM